jgi:succinate dehydrogenase / fumarate reductase cytochrome b subunit
MGLWLVVFLSQHLLVNAQMALYLQNDGASFISMVNKIHSLPFLPVIEIVVLAIPFLIHGILGIKYALTSKANSFKTKGSSPSLPEYPKNRAYTWQRLSSWILLVGVLAHVIHMRFVKSPESVYISTIPHYFVRLDEDRGLPIVVEKFGSTIYKEPELKKVAQELEEQKNTLATQKQEGTYFSDLNAYQERTEWFKTASSYKLKPGEVIVDNTSAGSAIFLVIRQTFKSPILVILYSIFVLSASFHAFNGLWTFMISWGATLTQSSQKLMRKLCLVFMGAVSVMGLMAIWVTYWIFQFQG